MITRPTAQARLRTALALYERGGTDPAKVSIMRVHMLPAEDVELVSAKGTDITLPLSDPDYLAAQVATMQQVLDKSGETLRPVRLNHKEGGHGWILDVVASERGIDVYHACVPGPWLAENPYVSGHWALDKEGDQWVITDFFEITHTDSPQFRYGQRLFESVSFETVGVSPETVAASFTVRGYTMTPEEIRALVEEMLSAQEARLVALIDEHLAAEQPEDETASAESDEEDEERAAAEQPEDEDDSVAASLKSVVARLGKLEKALSKGSRIAASLSGRRNTGEEIVPESFAARVNYYRAQGKKPQEAVAAARAHN